MRSGATPGGAGLRALREGRSRTQLWVEAEAELGCGYLQRLESGRVIQPGRPTLERILDALEARYAERREVLAAFGYAAAVPLPTEADLAWARAACAPDLGGVPFPAYALDCAHRLVAWNGRLARLFGFAPDDPRLGGLAQRSLLAAWFDPASPVGSLVAEPEVGLPAMIRAFRAERERFRGEAWSDALLARLQAESPRFRRYWTEAAGTSLPASAARFLAPLRLRAPAGGLLQFRLASEPLIGDPRFRVISLLPADAGTLRHCAAWNG